MNSLIVKAISEYDIKETEENNQLAVRARNGDKAALQEVVMNNLRIIINLANKYKRNDDEFDDLFQEGVCGLIRATMTYDETKGSFITHAHSWIRAMILKSFRRMEAFHYEPTFYNKYIRYQKLISSIGCIPSEFSDNELADFGLTTKDINTINKYMKKTYSMDAIIENYNNNPCIAENDIDLVDSSIEEQIYENDVKRTVSEEMERILTEKELFIIRHVYGIGVDGPNKMTKVAQMFAQEFGCKTYTRQNIQSIKKKAEAKLRNSKVLRDLLLS